MSSSLKILSGRGGVAHGEAPPLTASCAREWITHATTFESQTPAQPMGGSGGDFLNVNIPHQIDCPILELLFQDFRIG